jgi:uncharacterized membrane protein HdeD (DUF308 family)
MDRPRTLRERAATPLVLANLIVGGVCLLLYAGMFLVFGSLTGELVVLLFALIWAAVPVIACVLALSVRSRVIGIGMLVAQSLYALLIGLVSLELATSSDAQAGLAVLSLVLGYVFIAVAAAVYGVSEVAARLNRHESGSPDAA